MLLALVGLRLETSQPLAGLGQSWEQPILFPLTLSEEQVTSVQLSKALWKERNRESVRRQNKAYIKSHPEVEVRKRKRYYEKNKETRLLISREYSATHKERRAELNKAYYLANPEKSRIKCIVRRTKKTQAGGQFTPEEWSTLCFAVGFKCLCCKQVKPLEADHVMPVSLGGTSFLYNIQPLCKSCNVRKSTKCTDYRTQETQNDNT